MDNEEMFETLLIPMEDGTEMECAILDDFEVLGKKYIVVGPIEGDELTDEEYLYSYEEEGEDIIITSIDSDEELEAVYAEYEKLIAEAEAEEE